MKCFSNTVLCLPDAHLEALVRELLPEAWAALVRYRFESPEYRAAREELLQQASHMASKLIKIGWKAPNDPVTATAPNLLAVLKDLRNEGFTLRDRHDGTCADCQRQRAIRERANAAIAATEGA